ncbi:recombinase family protein [Hyphomicrobium sp. LHD-15]|uniref:recombinase family protein n=1 Tax=Hyphomicrobium sp. LHD-15 TaxID=3072142 RepID=UPI00280F35A4|nr:recombinase family protein [Hyphomicrobium sp. LHD-15]MDQ8698157.1 recombinase family protein [Hyphomicrobium sp. LHD-15]
MLVGYARVSTGEQSLDLQIDALEQAGCEQIFSDTGFSGALTSRPALDQAIALLKSGDTLVTWKLDRLGRSLSHLISLIAELENKQVSFKSLSDAIDTRTAGGRLQFHMLGALAEFERSLIGERTKAGMAAARARGSPLGRPPKLDTAKIDAAMLHAKRRPLSTIAKDLDVSPSTLRRAISYRRKVGS